MDDSKLKSIIDQEIRVALGEEGGEISEDRRKALDYYYGEPFGNEIEGRSSVVSTDVQDVIESVMPDFMEIFAGGEQVCRFEPEFQEDEEFSEQATDYANYIWNKDNDGFGVTHDWIKDALLQKNGVIKIFWEEKEVRKKETFENLNTLQLQELDDDPEVEIVEYEEKPFPEMPDGVVHDATIVRTRTEGRTRVIPVPPEEFLIARRAVSLKDAPFTCHKVRKTISELLEEGYSRKQMEDIPSGDDHDYNEERLSRFNDDEWPDEDDSLDPTMREIWLYECYLKVDYDGDGIAEMRKVTVAGPGYEILEFADGEKDNVEVDDHPFCSITPIRMPHKFFGRALADLVRDVQLIKSTIQRQLLDNMYLINNARSAVNDRVNLDDYLTNRPGGVVRVDGNGPVGDAIMPVVTAPLGPQAFNQLEYWDAVREMRTGVTRLNQGMDADSLNKTATGINQLLGRTQRRMLLIARVFAETGFRDAFRKILRLIVTRQDRERIIRLRNKWVPMDPKHWNADMDVTVAVGLGYGTKDQQTMLYRMTLEIQKEIIAFQGGFGGMVTADNVFNTLSKMMKSSGERDVTLFFSDPQTSPPPEKGPPPEMLELQAEMEKHKSDLAARLKEHSERLQWDMKRHRDDLEFKYAELAADAEQEQAKAAMEGVRDGIKARTEFNKEKVNG